MTGALPESVRFLIGGPRFGLSQRGRRGMIRQSRSGFPQHGHFGFTDSTASTLHRERDRTILQSPRSVSHPGGMPAISRGLSEATPQVSDTSPPTPEGVEFIRKF